MQHADPTADPTGLGALRTRRSELCGDEELTGGAWCSAWAAIVDEWLGGLYTDSRPQGLKASTALVAVGGYGRASLSPGSDLDLLLIHDGRARDVAKLADALWYPIWDSGISLDHSVRTIKELGTAMDSDVKVALGLLDMRLIAGDPTLAETARHKVVEAWRERSTRWLGDLHVVVKDRHDRFGDLAFLLEPDLKEARGGLRDVQLLRSLASVEPNLASTVADAAMARAEETLSAARVELQRNATTKSNVLLLQDQDRVAKARRTLDTHGRPDADALMARVAGSARTIAWASDDAWRRMTSPYLASKKRGQAVGLEPGIVVRDGEIGLLRAADPAIDPSLALRLAATSAEQDLPMARAALDRLAKRALPPRRDLDAGNASSAATPSRRRAPGDCGRRGPRPAGRVAAVPAGMGGGTSSASTQRIPPFHGRPPSSRDRGERSVAPKRRTPAGPAAPRCPATRHRQRARR